jgi:fumarylacetoacetase
MSSIDETHDEGLKSWVESANDPATDFPIQNLPLGRFRRPGEARYRLGVAIGDQIVDAAKANATTFDDMNALMAAGPAARQALRRTLSHKLRAGNDASLRSCLVAQSEVEMSVPCRIGDYTDFYTSLNHAMSVGKQFRPDNPLLPNYKWVPIGYHGRASSIGVSGATISRPRGQFKGPTD